MKAEASLPATITTKREYEAAERERIAREEGRTIPHYAGKVAKKLTTRRKQGHSTPSKRA
jgi:hypothetical protein